MANFKKMASFAPRINQPLSTASNRTTQTKLPVANSGVSSNFQQRMQVKKLMAAREGGAYDGNDFLKKRLERKIANLAGSSYGTHRDRLNKSLQRQSTGELPSESSSSELPTNFQSFSSSSSIPAPTPVAPVNSRPTTLWKADNRPFSPLNKTDQKS